MDQEQLSSKDQIELLILRADNIPQRLRYLRSARKINELERNYLLANMAITVDGADEPIYFGNIMEFTGPALLMAVIHCRFLLEFLGLKIRRKVNTPELMTRGCYQQSSEDIGIEHFKSPTGASLQPLQLGVADNFSNPDEVRQAWAIVIAVANQRVAHSTSDAKLGGIDSTTVSQAIEIALDTVPELVCREFYDRLGEARPI
ncbi:MULTISPECIES: hypothetical protein [pseudomallei group]|uniref:hypothetical protein n=1 Tax=pseudomallei group TaxID=111527 RepID=UPI0011780933|nr:MULTISPECIES: hypothetical protein [pseudomallei group]MBO7881678.1 hypothetical protein [Burkholderia pseudomallei]MCS6493613.1 hypothetical protein [Burkholderia thailandensis]NOK47966.1 hypothetical protein [Burkholderia thailandensis]